MSYKMFLQRVSEWSCFINLLVVFVKFEGVLFLEVFHGEYLAIYSILKSNI